MISHDHMHYTLLMEQKYRYLSKMIYNLINMIYNLRKSLKLKQVRVRNNYIFSETSDDMIAQKLSPNNGAWVCGICETMQLWLMLKR